MAGEPTAPGRHQPPYPPYGWFAYQAPQSSYGINSRILVTAILSLVFAIALVLVLYLYVRFVLRRHTATARWTTVTVFRSAVAAQGPDPPRAGLDAAAVARIPKFAYKPTAGEPPAECAICLSVVEEGEAVRVLPGCKHLFHVDCIDMWLHAHSTCPVCRAGAEPPPAPPASVAVRVEAGEASGGKEESSVSRLSSSFRWMLSRERSGRRLQADGMEDLERQ